MIAYMKKEIKAQSCISSLACCGISLDKKARVYIAFCEYIIKSQEDARKSVMRYSPIGADDIRMYISPQASYTFNDIPSLRLG